MATPSSATLAQRHKRLYLLRVLLKNAPHNLPGVSEMRGGLFVFALHPQQVRYQAPTRAQAYPVGIDEVAVDQQGVSPPIIQISGTFGEQGGHLNGKGLDGRQAQRGLENVVRGFALAVAQAGRQRRPLPQLEWHDLYRAEHWIVKPDNVPYGSEDQSSPLRETYSLTLTGLKLATNPPTIPDPLPAAMNAPHAACPLNPGCKIGGPSTPGCPYTRK